MFRVRRTSSVDRLLKKMQRDWDERARTNARHFIATGQLDWSLEDFLESGMENVRENEILTDMQNIGNNIVDNSNQPKVGWITT